MEFASELFTITLFLAASFILSELFFRLKYPRVVGYILAGILLGYPALSNFFLSGGNFFVSLENDNPSAVALELLADLGIVFLMLLTGLEIDLRKLGGLTKEVLLIAGSAAFVPFVFGFIVMRSLGYPDVVAFVVGACLSLTAEGTKDVILMELGKLNSRVGEIMLGAGAVDDIFGTIFLAIILVAAKTESVGLTELSGLSFLAVEFLIFVVISYLAFRILPGVVHFIQEEKSEVSEFSIVVIMGLLVAGLSEILGLGTIIGALVAGVIIQVAIEDREEERRMVKDLKVVTLGLVIPFFFISVGLKFWGIQMHLFSFGEVSLFLVVILIATFGKIIGSVLVKPFTTLSRKQLYLIGWGMNSRGAIELVIVMVAQPFLPAEIFSSIVLMAVFTTMLFPFVLRHTIRNDPGIMD